MALSLFVFLYHLIFSGPTYHVVHALKAYLLIIQMWSAQTQFNSEANKWVEVAKNQYQVRAHLLLEVQQKLRIYCKDSNLPSKKVSKQYVEIRAVAGFKFRDSSI